MRSSGRQCAATGRTDQLVAGAGALDADGVVVAGRALACMIAVAVMVVPDS